MLARKLQQLGYDTLDVTSRSWFSDLLAFLTGTEGLEKQLVFALQQAYSTAGHLSARLKLLPVRTKDSIPRYFRTFSEKMTTRPKPSKGPILSSSNDEASIAYWMGMCFHNSSQVIQPPDMLSPHQGKVLA